MPVVSAAILAALLVPAYARMKEQDKSFDLSTMSSRDAAGAGTTKAGSPAGKGKAGKGAGKSAKGGAAAAKASSGAGASAKSSSSAASGARLLERLQALMPLCAAAESTSVLCTCETSGGVSESGIVQCSESLMCVCRSCGFRVDLRSHDMRDHACCTGGVARRDGPSPAVFEQTLRREAPTSIALDAASVQLLADRGVELPSGEYRLTRVHRDRGAWTLGYSVCDEAARPCAELRVSIGRLGTGRGLSALLFSFAPALRGERGRMPPVARMLLPAEQSGTGSTGTQGKQKAGGKQPASSPPAAQWEVLCEPRGCELTLTAASRVPSYRSEVGLIKYKEEEWPDELHVAGEPDVAGVYHRQACRFSVVFGALWKRSAPAAGAPALWLFVRPTVDRTAPDEVVIARSPAFRDCDTHAVMEVVPVVHSGKAKGGEGGDAAKQTPFELLCVLGAGTEAGHAKKKAKAAGGKAVAVAGAGSSAEVSTVVSARAKVWETLELGFVVPHDATTVSAHTYGCTLSSLPEATTRKLLAATSATLGMVAGSNEDVDGWKELRVLTASSTVAERRLVEAVAAPMLQFAARGGLGALTGYQELKKAKGAPAWGACETAAPPRPPEIWTDEGLRT